MNNCAVIGLGAIGSILSAHLLKAGMNVTLVEVLKDRVLSMSQKGLQVKDPRSQIIGDLDVSPEKYFFSCREMKDKPDCIFICTKTYNLMDVAKELKGDIFSSSLFVIFQNGLDNEDSIAELLGKEKVLRCVNNYAGMMRSDNEVDITFFNKPNYIGVMDEKSISKAQEIAKALTDTGIETKYSDQIKKHEWEKAILNGALASVTAATGLTMKDVMDYKPLRVMVENLIHEGIKAGESTGIQFKENFFEFCVSYLSKGGYHKPSMLLDIEGGGRTEIDFINGKIVEYGEKHGIDVPYNKMITAIVRGLEQRNLKSQNSSPH